MTRLGGFRNCRHIGESEKIGEFHDCEALRPAQRRAQAEAGGVTQRIQWLRWLFNGKTAQKRVLLDSRKSEPSGYYSFASWKARKALKSGSSGANGSR